jgi:hypothetical protein
LPSYVDAANSSFRLDVIAGLASQRNECCVRSDYSGPSDDQRYKCRVRIHQLAVHSHHACLHDSHDILQYLGCQNIADVGNDLLIWTCCGISHYSNSPLGVVPEKFCGSSLYRGSQQWRMEQHRNCLSGQPSHSNVLQFRFGQRCPHL